MTGFPTLLRKELVWQWRSYRLLAVGAALCAMVYAALDSLAGVADGLAEDGGLRLRTRAGVRSVRSGRVVSARAA